MADRNQGLWYNALAPFGEPYKPSPVASLKPGPEPTGSERVQDAIYSWLGGRPENRATASALTDLFNVGTLGMATGAYDGAKELAQTGQPSALAMALMPGAKLPSAAGKAVFVSRAFDPTNTGWIFKDVGSPNRLMEPGDWRRVNMAMENNEVLNVDLPIRSMTATQGKVNADYDNPVRSAANELPFVIKKNGQYFVRDGHHRLTRQAMSGKETAPVRLVDLDGTTQTEFPLFDRRR